MEMEISHETNQDSSNTGQPHESFYLVLPYLPLFELLAMAEVCRSFTDALNDDILSWLNIVVDEKHRKRRISDGILMKITSKATGRLNTLVLINCTKITDHGLQDVIAMNPNINKLHVQHCIGLTPEGIIGAVTMLNLHDATLTSLKINGIFNLTKEHLQRLHSLLKPDQIDVGICPKCDEVTMVYDCPLETCERKRTMRGCRGCKSCVSRCEECGKCVGFNEDEDSEAACEDKLCEDCWIQLPKCGFCNKPYCTNHAYKQCLLPNSSGFVCEACYYGIHQYQI
ncbi:F-box protein SKIP28 [Cynara cardunculus var. scolymus]|uniref:F-box protein SKIP28 n=1 Tax=Cynara cardunculus var. scolymus TaxID=59895 RepID=UPI000D6272F1|nr:F-box protein SKIP28 [Cynara cardunculus var. scolymus]